MDGSGGVFTVQVNFSQNNKHTENRASLQDSIRRLGVLVRQDKQLDRLQI